MNARTRTLLAIAMSTALVAPVAFAQKTSTKTSTEVKSTGDVTSQATTQKITLPQAVTPKPHRIARVTTCRCGGQQAQPDDQQ